MSNHFTLLNLSSKMEPLESHTRGGLTTLNLKSGPPISSDGFIPQVEFSLVNLPGQFFRRGKITLKEAMAHELAFRCLAFKALVVQDVVPIVQKFDGKKWEPDLFHPALPALRNPNPDDTAGDLLAFILLCEDVFGVAYLEKIYSKTKAVIGLAPLDPRIVREVPKPGATPLPMFWTADGGYKLSDLAYYDILEGSGSRRLAVDDVVPIRVFDVRSPLAGYSSTYVAFNKIGLGQSLDKYIDCYLSSGGPSGIFKVKNRTLSPEEAEDIQEKIYKQYRLGGEKHGRSIVLDDDGEYQPLGAHLGELGNETLRFEEQAAICTAYGVPGQLVQAFYAIRYGNQRAGQDAAMKQFWDNTMSPTLTRQRAQLDKYFLADFDLKQAGITTRVFWDMSNVKALQEDADKKAARFNSAYGSKAVSKNEYRVQLGLEPVEGGDFIPNDEEAYEQSQERLNQQAKEKTEPGKEKEKDDQKKTSAREFHEGLREKLGQKSRKPTELEEEQIPAVEKAQNEAKEKLTAILLLIKAGLIEQGLEKLKQLRADFARLSLTLTPQQEQQIKDAIVDAYQAGELTLATQASVPDPRAVTQIFTALSGALVVGLAARLISSYSLRALRGRKEEEILAEIAKESSEESTAWYEQLASGAAFQAVADGRDSEARRRRYKRVYYSALLDKNVCDPCKADDGKWSDDVKDLPPVPNPYCEGRWRCRCAHIYVWEE